MKVIEFQYLSRVISIERLNRSDRLNLDDLDLIFFFNNILKDKTSTNILNLNY